MNIGKERYVVRTAPVDEMPDTGPTGPVEEKAGGIGLTKILFFLLIVLYFVISYYHAPILSRIGSYLVVQHDPEQSDMIVCLAGKNVERGLATAEAYDRGLAPRILLTREVSSPGYEVLSEKGISYPESVELLTSLLVRLGVPGSQIITGDRPVANTAEEADLVRQTAKEKGIRSLIIVTSPTHSRRAWTIFDHAFRESGVRLYIITSPYSGFLPEEWWKDRYFLREVVLEYQKLAYYYLSRIF